MVDDSNSIIEMRTQLAEQERTIKMLLATRAAGGDADSSERSSLLHGADNKSAGSAKRGSAYGSIDMNVSVNEAAARAAAVAAVGQPKVVVRVVVVFLMQSNVFHLMGDSKSSFFPSMHVVVSYLFHCSR